MNHIDLSNKNIEDLPAIDIWPLIFRNLSINDLINCRLVNKKFKFFSTNCVYRLIVFKSEYFNCYNNYYWHYNKETIDDKHQISFEHYQKWKSLNLFNLNENLKYLIISHIGYSKFNLKELSYLNNLEYLHIELWTFFEDQFINLDRLKFLILKENCSLFEFKLNLNTPKLMKLEAYCMKNIYFESNPESIKHLITEFNDVSILKIFNNLEIIELKSSQNVDQLIVFRKLRKIKFCDSSSINVIKNILNKMYDLRDIDIYFKDVKIENINKIDEYQHFDNLEYQIKNYDQLDSNLSTIITQLDYNRLQCWFYNLKYKLTSSFFIRFSHLIKIVAYENVNNASNLIWFLRNLKGLRELDLRYYYFDLRDGSLDQNFYDNLPNTIRKLSIVSNTTINYDFILKFTELNEFTIYGNIDLFDLAVSSFANLKYLKKFQFTFNQEIKITKSRDKFILLVSLAVYKSPTNCFNQLVNLLNEIRLKVAI